jgi:Mg-chelatase subunit ChlD
MDLRWRGRGWVVLVAWLGLVRCECADDFGLGAVPGTVEATLCDPVSGLASAGHTLEVSGKDGTLQAVSDQSGMARLTTVPPGDVVIRFRHLLPDGTQRTDHEETTQLDERATLSRVDAACINPPLRPGRGGIQGQVCNRHTGTLLADAEVTTQGPAGEQHATRTDQGGFFSLPDVSAGDHLLTVRAATFQRAYPVHVEAGEVTRLDLGSRCHPFDPDRTGSLAGRLCATNGGGPWPLALVTVELPGDEVRQDLTDADGEFLVEGLPAGEWTVRATGGGESVVFTATVVVGQVTRVDPVQQCDVPDPGSTGAVRGQLCDEENGGWLTEALARCQQGGREFLDHTDERGRFHLAGLAPGEVVITVERGTLRRSFTVPIVVGVTVTVADGACAPPTGECRDQVLDVEDAAPLRIVLVVDKSGSMEEAGLGGVKWERSKEALKSVTLELGGEAAFGLALFPAGSSLWDQCLEGDMEVEPAVDNARLIAAVLDQTEPGGGTPTGATMDAVRSWAANRTSDVTTVAILATDGVPNCNAALDPSACSCPSGGCQGDGRSCLDDVATVESVRALATLGVRTYVIGLPGSADPTDVLARMARAGGTQTYYQPGSAAELAADMAGIVRSNRTCRFELERAPNDPQRVRVRLDGEEVPRDPGRRAGWDLVGERGVELFGTACQDLREGTRHALVVTYCVD